MRRAILATTVAFLMIAGSAVAAPPTWFAEGTGFITTVNPGADCSPEVIGLPPFPCSIGDYVVYNGVALKGSCAGGDATFYGCEFRVSHDENPPDGGPYHDCKRNTFEADKERAWFWSRYQPPEPAAAAELATLAECIGKETAAADSDPTTTDGQMSFEKQGKGLFLSGSAPTNGGNLAKRLTVTLPKGVSFNPKHACSRSVARALTLRTRPRCTQLMSGRLNDPNTTAWFSFAGPKQSGGRRKVWLRARRGDALAGFGTGTIHPPSGSYGEKLVVNLGQLDLNTSSIELFAEHLRSTKRCGSGRRYRLELVTDAGTVKSSQKDGCGGRGGSRG